jgi:hypothetical protein
MERGIRTCLIHRAGRRRLDPVALPDTWDGGGLVIKAAQRGPGPGQFWPGQGRW